MARFEKRFLSLAFLPIAGLAIAPSAAAGSQSFSLSARIEPSCSVQDYVLDPVTNELSVSTLCNTETFALAVTNRGASETVTSVSSSAGASIVSNAAGNITVRLAQPGFQLLKLQLSSDVQLPEDISVLIVSG